jgi:hypothetical protein
MLRGKEDEARGLRPADRPFAAREALVNPNKALWEKGTSPALPTRQSTVSHYLADKSALDHFTSSSLLDHF